MPQPSLSARIRAIPGVVDSDQYRIERLLIDSQEQDLSFLQPRVVHSDGFILFQVTPTLPLPATTPVNDPVYELATHKLIPYEDIWIGSIVAPTSNLSIELEYEPKDFDRPRLYLVSSTHGINPIPPLDTGIETTVTWQVDDLLLPNDGWVVTWTRKK